MSSMLLVVFVLQLGIHALSLVGAEAISSVLWSVYNKLPTPQLEKHKAISKLRQEVIELKSQMDNTSAQDDFAKWAKLRRQHDKKKDEYDKQARDVQDLQSSFNRSIGIAKWITTSGLRYVLQWWFGKQAMFYLPKGWVPYAAEWILSFPSAPLGSISISMWWSACAAIISMAYEVLQAARTLGSTTQPAKEKMAMASRQDDFNTARSRDAEKKEL